MVGKLTLNYLMTENTLKYNLENRVLNINLTI